MGAKTLAHEVAVVLGKDEVDGEAVDATSKILIMLKAQKFNVMGLVSKYAMDGTKALYDKVVAGRRA